VLTLEASNVESLASLAAFQFYLDQPEVALRYYRRLLQMGIDSAALWNNIGLSCYYSGQLDMCLTCFERALQSAEGDVQGDIWYNLSHLSIGIGDQGLAYQCLKVALAADPSHVEAQNNLAVMELKKGNVELARTGYREAHRLGPHTFEPPFNAALLAFKLGDTQDSFNLVNKALECYPEHADSKELLATLQARLA
jgi:tetratricopeptide repeat protein 8